MQTEKGHNLILLLVYIKHVIFQLTFFYFPIYLNDNGFSGFQIGILMSIFSITGLIILFPAGILNDRFLSRSLLFISFLIGALCYFGILVSNIFIVMAIM